MSDVFIYHNGKEELPYLLPAIRLAFLFHNKGGF